MCIYHSWGVRRVCLIFRVSLGCAKTIRAERAELDKGPTRSVERQRTSRRHNQEPQSRSRHAHAQQATQHRMSILQHSACSHP